MNTFFSNFSPIPLAVILMTIIFVVVLLAIGLVIRQHRLDTARRELESDLLFAAHRRQLSANAQRERQRADNSYRADADTMALRGRPAGPIPRIPIVPDAGGQADT